MRRLFAFALVLALAPSTKGDIITYPFLIDSRIQPGIPPQFNPDLGTLTAVGLTFHESIGGTGMVTNLTPYTGTATALQGNRVTGPGLLLDLAPDPALLSMPFSSSGTLFTYGTNLDYSTMTTDPATLTGFTGHSTVWVQVTGGPPAYQITSGQVLGFPKTVDYLITGTGEIAYTYEAIPEPPALVLAGIGLATVGGVRVLGRRRASTA